MNKKTTPKAKYSLFSILMIVFIIASLVGCSQQATDPVNTTAETTVTDSASDTASDDQANGTSDSAGQPPEGQAPGGTPPDGQSGFNVESGSAVESTGVYLLDGSSATETGLTLTSTEANESTIKATNGADLTVTDAVLTKSSGDMTVEEASDFFGANAGVLVNEGSTLSLSDTTITTTATGGNAVFSTGEGTTVTLDNVTIYTTEDHSRGLDATYTGTINASNVSITTQGAHSAAVATDRGEGTLTVDQSELNTSGEGSPSIYSTGDITVTNSVGTATGSGMAVIEGKNSIDIENTSLSANAIGRGNGGIDNAGVMIYQSMSGDADSGSGSFTALNSSLEILKTSNVFDTAPMFFVTNTDAEIYLSNTQLTYGSGILLRISGNDGEWGTEGSNGGNTTFTVTDQSMAGAIEVDDISTLDLTLKGSDWAGTVDHDNVASYVSITLDKTSSWTLTADAYVDVLVDSDTTLSNIISNGHNIYYDGSLSENAWLNGKTITLNGGGKVMPN